MARRTLYFSLCLAVMLAASLPLESRAGSGRFGSGTSDAAHSSATYSSGSSSASRPYSTGPSTFGNNLKVPGANDALSSPTLNPPSASAPSFSSLNTSTADMDPSSSTTRLSPSSGGGSATSGSQSSGALPLRGLVGGPAPDGAAASGSIESFFQISPSNMGSKSQDNSRANKENKERKVKSTNSALWHIMDNIGIPMFGGSHEDSLDPMIRRNYVNPPLPNPDQLGKGKQPDVQLQMSHDQKSRTQNQTNSPKPTTINTKKIPESELEGIELPAKNDSKKEQK